jgi:hypothetical protein
MRHGSLPRIRRCQRQRSVTLFAGAFSDACLGAFGPPFFVADRCETRGGSLLAVPPGTSVCAFTEQSRKLIKNFSVIAHFPGCPIGASPSKGPGASRLSTKRITWSDWRAYLRPDPLSQNQPQNQPQPKRSHKLTDNAGSDVVLAIPCSRYIIALCKLLELFRYETDHSHYQTLSYG